MSCMSTHVKREPQNSARRAIQHSIHGAQRSLLILIGRAFELESMYDKSVEYYDNSTITLTHIALDPLSSQSLLRLCVRVPPTMGIQASSPTHIYPDQHDTARMSA